MVRAVLLLVAVAGCDQVWQLERDVPPAVCGPYSSPVEVVFSPTISDPHDFSVDSSGTRGLIYGEFPRAPRATGVHAIKLVNDEWVIDPEREAGAITSLDGAHISENDFLIGWLDKSSVNLPQISEYQYFPTTRMWGGPASGVVDSVQSETSIAGNLIVTGTQKFVVTTRLSDDDMTNSLRVFEYGPPGNSWALTGQAAPLGVESLKLNARGAVMTADHGKLVYAAEIAHRDFTQLFATYRTRDEFRPGVPLIIEDVPADADLTEPWIDGDCGTLYFRRDEKTWMATALVDPSPGQ
ncbi:MAG: hypothetical protein JWP01_208 [Myxococcales bacterium]|nr:hypothetical protein [Myxococcales bacterium]